MMMRLQLLEGTEEIVSVLDRNQLGPTVLDQAPSLACNFSTHHPVLCQNSDLPK